MEKKITITVPDDMVAELDELVREEGRSEGEIILNAIKRRIAGSKIRTLEELKASIAEDFRSKQTS